jgi:phenylacetate-CoA ligase
LGEIGSFLTDFSAQEYAGIQFASKERIEKIQTRLFLQHMHYTHTYSEFYRKRYKECGIDIRTIHSLQDMVKLPLTTKEDLQATELFCCADQKEIVDICLTSATSSAVPTMIPLTGNDLARLAYNEERALSMTGVCASDVLLICAALDRCFMAGMAYFLGGAKLSAAMIRAGSGSASQHWELIKRLEPTAIVGVPSLMYKIGEYAINLDKNPADSRIKKLIAIGEPTRNEAMNLLPIASELETMWNAKIFSTYASSEMATTFCECEARAGGHLRPELIIVEILDETGNVLPAGEIGEVVVTPLGITGMPLIRFRTGDLSYIIDDPCACNRTTLRLAPVIGRKKQMLKYKGTTLYPNAIISALEGDERFHNGYIEAKKYPDGTDRIILYAAVTINSDQDDLSWIRDRLRATLRVVPEIEMVSPKQADQKVYQSHKKRKRMTFFDLR